MELVELERSLFASFLSRSTSSDRLLEQGALQVAHVLEEVALYGTWNGATTRSASLNGSPSEGGPMFEEVKEMFRNYYKETSPQLDQTCTDSIPLTRTTCPSPPLPSQCRPMSMSVSSTTSKGSTTLNGSIPSSSGVRDVPTQPRNHELGPSPLITVAVTDSQLSDESESDEDSSNGSEERHVSTDDRCRSSRVFRVHDHEETQPQWDASRDWMLDAEARSISSVGSSVSQSSVHHHSNQRTTTPSVKKRESHALYGVASDGSLDPRVVFRVQPPSFDSTTESAATDAPSLIIDYHTVLDHVYVKKAVLQIGVDAASILLRIGQINLRPG